MFHPDNQSVRRARKFPEHDYFQSPFLHLFLTALDYARPRMRSELHLPARVAARDETWQSQLPTQSAISRRIRRARFATLAIEREERNASDATSKQRGREYQSPARVSDTLGSSGSFRVHPRRELWEATLRLMLDELKNNVCKTSF